MKITIIGGTGYTGAELLRLLSGHKQAEVIALTSEKQAGTAVEEVYPHLRGRCPLVLMPMQQALEEAVPQSDAVFLALPHGHAMEVGRRIGSAAKLIDLGADYRFRDPEVYEAWYKLPHTHREAQAVYGLTELYRHQIRKAQIVGNPGCYTTASILALAPLVKEGLVELDTLLIDAKSGVTGSGRGSNLGTHMCEVTESVRAYNVGRHRHTPEIEQALSELAGQAVTLNFTPHLIPMARGILSSCYACLKPGITPAQVDQAFYDLYGQEYFIRLLGRDVYPATKQTRGSNYCDIGWHVDQRTGRVIVLSAIDNLVKGASGQAIQNMNVLFGLDEKEGLTGLPMYP